MPTLSTLELPIETERLRIRRHEPRDRDAFVALVIDPRFSEHLSVPARQKTAEGAAEVFDMVMSSYDTEEPIWGLTVADREQDVFLGTVAMHTVPFGEALELFYAIEPSRWRQGYAVEAVRALLDTLPERDFVALTALDNVASQKVAHAAGMKDEGRFEPLGGPARHRFARPAK